MIRWLSCVCGFLLSCSTFVVAEHYSIVSPGTLHSNTNYSIIVTAHTTKAARIKVGIVGPDFESKSEVALEPLSFKNVDIAIPKLGKGPYSLIAEGISGLIFKNSSVLNVADKDYGVFVQTDRATYKPGDLMQFRVLFLDECTRPAKLNEPIVIYVKDAAKNRVTKFSNVTLKTGVFKESLQLSEYPILGDWLISVLVNEVEIYNKTFRVDKYVLPKFKVIIDAPRKFLVTDEKLSFAIYATYTFGKPVIGKAFVNISSPALRRTPNGAKNEEVELTGQRNENQFLEFSMSDLFLGATNRKATAFTITVVVVEKITGNRQNATAIIQTVKNKFNIIAPTIECTDAGNDVQYTVTVTDIDDKPVSDERGRITFKPDTGVPTFGFLNEGKATTVLACPAQEELNIKITYGKQYEYGVIIKHKFAGIMLKNDEVEVNKPLQVEFTSDEYINYFVYAIVAHGKIVDSNTEISSSGSKNSYTFSITPTIAMMPRAQIFVYYIKDSDFKFFDVSFQVKDNTLNKISIDVAKDTVAPGQNVNLTIHTNANSYVGLLAVDQSVNLLRTGNDLSLAEIEKSLQEISSETPKYLNSGYTYPGGDVGLVTLTNAHFVYLSGDQSDITIRSDRELPRVHVRKNFLETWFYEDYPDIPSTDLSITRKAPDTITTWFIAGFSLNPITGLALTASPTKVTTFKSFFITTNLPYAIKRGEALSVPVIIFNYFTTELQVRITISNDDEEYDFMDNTGDPRTRTKIVLVPRQNSTSTNFEIRAKRLGYIKLNIRADTYIGSDAIQQKLKVEPEGVTKFKNKGGSLKNVETVKVNIDIPANVVLDSVHMEASVMGHILSQPIDTLGDPDTYGGLVRLPTGCGEQVMVNLAPNILLLKYFAAANKSSPTVERKAREYIKSGYALELSYRKNDGSFAVFTSSRGSTWLTAYVIRTLHQASQYIYIESKVLREGLAFLSRQQTSRGDFEEKGSIFSSRTPLAQTAYVLLTFLEHPQHAAAYTSTIDRGIEYLEDKIHNNNDVESLVVAAYTLRLRKPETVRQMLAKLNALAQTAGEHKWWSNVVTTSYMLVILIDLDEPVVPVVKWLLSKRNSYGGFDTSIETVVGLEALAKFAEKNLGDYSDFQIDIMDGTEMLGKFPITKDNEVVMQKLPLQKSDVRQLTLKSKGQGTGQYQISYQFNVLEDEESPYFRIKVNIEQNPGGGKILLNVKIEFLLVEERDTQEKNMIIAEISLPSGFAITPDSMSEIEGIRGVHKLETRMADTKVIIYFLNMKVSKEIRIPIEAEREHGVANQQPVPIYIYEYYDTTWRKHATHYYKHVVNPCDICADDDDECRENCA